MLVIPRQSSWDPQRSLLNRPPGNGYYILNYGGEKADGGFSTEIARVVLLKQLPDGNLISFSDCSGGALISHKTNDETSYLLMLGPWGSPFGIEISKGAKAGPLEKELELKVHWESGVKIGKAKLIERLKPIMQEPAEKTP